MSKIITVIQNHKNLGFIIKPYFYNETEHFIEVTEAADIDVLKKYDKLSENETNIIKSCDAYSDKNLTKIFGRKQKSREFFNSLTKDDIEKRIRPFIEKISVNLIDKIAENNIKLYFKKDKFTTLYEEELLNIQTEPAKTVFNIEKTEDGTKYYLSIKHNSKHISLFQKSAYILTNKPCRLILDNNLYFFDDIDGKKLLPFFKKEHIFIPRSFEKKWFETFALNAMKKFTVNPVGFSVKEITPPLKAVLSAEKDWKGEYAFLLFFYYEKTTYQYGINYDTKIEFNFDNFEFIKNTRNKNAENNLIAGIKKLGLKEHNEGILKINFSEKNIEKQHHKTILWLKEHTEQLEKIGLELKQNFFKKEYFTEKISLNLHTENKKDWFDIYGTAVFGKFKIPFIKLKNNILSGNREFVLPDKSIAIIPEEWFAKYSELFMFGENKNENLKISKTHFNTLELAGIKAVDNEFKNNIAKLLNYKKYKVSIPDNIKAELRPYQKEGFKIMRFLRDADFGVCLADDMGLGKTLQTITLLQDTINERKKNNNNFTGKRKNTEQLSIFNTENTKQEYSRKASLIIMPVSLIHNWDNELRKFAPELKVLKYKGANRQKHIKKFNDYDVILAGYASVRNDIEKIEKYEFLYVILDESQFIKNSSSKTYKAVSELVSEYKAVLTGTPVENSLSDLWSQMNFINNGMLGNEAFFKETFIKPIEKAKDEISEQKLKSIISPFIIRRTKNEVAKDLPELTEQIIYCVQHEEQGKIYETEKSKIRNKFLELEETGQKQNISAEVLAALMKLRQIANHPVLTDKNYEGESGKFNEVIRNLENIISENHKVLIFSSFVKHLQLFADYLENNGIKYSMLTGQTKNREDAISEFQNKEENKVFLISIKAGGTGLNLTEADYVFILDPWWNPAVEKQAVNRAHRIGQKRKVMVYKYITENTVEEKILNLQKSKSKLADSIISSENRLGKLTEEMLAALLDI